LVLGIRKGKCESELDPGGIGREIKKDKCPQKNPITAGGKIPASIRQNHKTCWHLKPGIDIGSPCTTLGRAGMGGGRCPRGKWVGDKIQRGIRFGKQK